MEHYHLTYLTLKFMKIKSVILFGLISVMSLSLLAQEKDPYQEVQSWQFGKSRETLFKIDEIIRSTKPDGYKNIEKRLITLLNSQQTTKDAKRYICKWLVIVGSEECVPAVAQLLTDPELSHPARMVLEPLQSQVAGEALRNALSKVQGKLLAGVISSIGVRRDTKAVGAIKLYATGADPVVAENAIAALGEIGNDEALTVLENIRPPQNLERAHTRALITAAGHLADAGFKTRAAAVYKKIFDSSSTPAFRYAAINGIVNTLPQNQAVAFLIEQLQSKDEHIRGAAASAFRHCPDTALKNNVAEKLPNLEREAQLLVLGILSDIDDVNGRTPSLKLLQTSNDDTVLIAALDCLARHGEAADVQTIAQIATKKPSLSNAVIQTLQRISKPGTDNALVKLFETDASARAIALNVLSNRRVESALPTFVRLLRGNDIALATEAAKGLATLGTDEQVKELSDVIIKTEDDGLRNVAASAIKSIARKSKDKTALSQTIVNSFDAAKTVQARTTFLQLLVFTGGESALKTVVNSLNNPNQEVKNAAFESLVSWGDDSVVPYLIGIAKNTADEKQAIVALRDGCLRLAEMEEIPLQKRIQILQDVLQVAKRIDEKKRAVSLLGEIPTPDSLKILQKAASIPELKTDAYKSTIRLARQIGAIYPDQAISALEEVKSNATDEGIRKQAEQAIASVKNAGLSPDGFVLAWLICGPFTKEGKDGSALFNEAFPPEQAGSTVQWKPYTVPPNKKNGLVEFDKMSGFKGNDRVAYLKTTIISDEAQDAQLEFGSDDGLKVWLNGKIVHSNNAVRPCVPGQDKVKVKLAKGENTLLIKLTQGGGEWAVSSRIRSIGGKELNDITILPKI